MAKMPNTPPEMSDDLPEELVIPIGEVIHNNHKWTELRLSEPSAKTINDAMAVLKLDANGNAAPATMQPFFMKLISSHTGLPISVVEQLKISVVNKAGNYLANFSGRGILPASQP